MGTMREEYKQILADDATLAALLPGGVFDADDLPPEGMTTQEIPRKADGIGFAEFAVLSWKTISGTEIVGVSERRFLEVYFYAQRGYSQIEQAQARAKMLLSRREVAASDTSGMAMSHFVQHMGELPAEEYGNAACTYSRYYVDYTRR